MEYTRDVYAISLVGSENRPADNYTSFSRVCEPKEEKNSLPDDSLEKLSLIAEALNETIAEENARSREITELLGKLEIDKKSVSNSIEDSFNKVTAVLRAEGLSEMDETMLKIQMESKTRESMRMVREKRKFKVRYDELCDRHSRIRHKENIAKEAVKEFNQYLEAERTENEEEYTNRIFMGTKLNDYKQTAEQLQETLDQLVTDDCYPETILKKYDCQLKLDEELNLLTKSLSKYGDLPANLSEARMKVEDEEKWVKDLDFKLLTKMK